jgi:hypothetical protein
MWQTPAGRYRLLLFFVSAVVHGARAWLFFVMLDRFVIPMHDKPVQTHALTTLVTELFAHIKRTGPEYAADVPAQANDALHPLADEFRPRRWPPSIGPAALSERWRRYI